MKQIFTSCLALLFCALAGCSKSDVSAGSGTTPNEEGEEIVVVDGKVRFYLSVDDAALRVLMGTPKHSWSTDDQIRVNNKRYPVQVDSKNRPYVDVDATEEHAYRAGFYEQTKYFPISCFTGVLLPHAQYYKGVGSSMPEFPMYAVYTKEMGNKLVFKEGCAALGVGLRGSAAITSIKVEDAAGVAVAGYHNFDGAQATLVADNREGIGFVTLNCTLEGVAAALTTTEQTFYLAIPARNYASGLRVTICDSDHCAMFYDVPAVTLAPNALHRLSMDYAPKDDLIFYDGFDNCVWGGNIMAGEGSLGLSPTDEKVGVDSGKEYTGYEEPLVSVDYENAGSGFMQPNTWNSNLDVSENHQMSKSYLCSRNLFDYGKLFRCQEYLGCVAVGAGSTSRGILQTGGMKNIGKSSSIEVSFKFCLQANISDDLLFEVVNGGMIASCTLNGQPLTLTDDNYSYQANASMLTIAKELVEIPSTASAKGWNTVTAKVDLASDATALYWASSTSVAAIHGIYVDEIKVTKVKGSEMITGPNNLRVLFWNIQNGMWSDQGNNYDNFVAWVKRYDPDVCVWCEAQTNYKTGAETACPAADRYLPDNWGKLAARYGHTYWVKGAHRDNFPQVITSKFPITKIEDIAGSSEIVVSHGAGHSRIAVNGKEIDLVTLHLWPQSYAYGVPASGQAASTAKNEGDKYRLKEMTHICQQTVLNTTYSGVQNWLMLGDFNSRSVYDNWFYNYAATDTKLYVTKYLDEQTQLVDVIAKRYPDYFVSSTGGNSRIDYLFASQSMYDRIDNAITVIDSFARPKADPVVSFYHPSDHRPILVDFDMK